jgi:SAM-dependent methyltransferase
MNESLHSAADLQQLYERRFAGKREYRQRVWEVLCEFFAQWIDPEGSALDLGCGYCEFINNVRSTNKLAIDLNPDASKMAIPGVNVLIQDCSERWHVPPETLDTVFTSNFFEHLPNKAALERTLGEAFRALKAGGRLIALGPNIKYLAGAYWDFYDHHLPLTELSLIEILRKCNFEIDVYWDRFLPYTMSDGKQYPIWTLKAYLAVPQLWKIFGKQFLVIGRKPS